MPRLFTGLKFAPEITEQLSLLRGGVSGARWISSNDYHLTLRFIGDVDDLMAERFAEGLEAIQSNTFELELISVGSFGGKTPRSLWAGVSPSQALLALQLSHEMLAQKIGLPPETRKFSPHVTLARLKKSPLDDVRNYLAYFGGYKSPKLLVQDFVLFSAKSSIGGGPYVVEEVYPLVK